jgi:uncharacterized membrane protein
MRQLAVVISVACATVAYLLADITLIVAAVALGCAAGLALRHDEGRRR